MGSIDGAATAMEHPIVNKSNKITILLPTLNEEENIRDVIEELPISDLKTRGYRVEILVVDGKSTDRTKEIAQAHGADVILQEGKVKVPVYVRHFLTQIQITSLCWMRTGPIRVHISLRCLIGWRMVMM